MSSIETLLEKLLRHKKERIRGEWEGKQDVFCETNTQERYFLIQRELHNYPISLGDEERCQEHPQKYVG